MSESAASKQPRAARTHENNPKEPALKESAHACYIELLLDSGRALAFARSATLEDTCLGEEGGGGWGLLRRGFC